MQIFKQIGSQFDRSFARKAYLHNYLNLPLFNGDDSEFKECREVVREVVEEYAQVQNDSYLQWLRGQSWIVCYQSTRQSTIIAFYAFPRGFDAFALPAPLPSSSSRFPHFQPLLLHPSSRLYQRFQRLQNFQNSKDSQDSQDSQESQESQTQRIRWALPRSSDWSSDPPATSSPLSRPPWSSAPRAAA